MTRPCRLNLLPLLALLLAVAPPAQACGACGCTLNSDWASQGYALKPDCSRGERPGHVTLRRLNRAEYNNTVRDLFGVSITPGQTALTRMPSAA